MERIDIQSEYREDSGKGAARRLRREGKIPAILYSKGESTRLVLYPKQIQQVLHSEAGENALLTLKMPGEEQQHVALLRDYQKDPLTGKILHADLFEVSMDETVDVKVLVEITGSTPIGVKAEGGVLRQHLREIEIRCLPTKIPDHIQIDASGLKVGDTIHIEDLALGEGIEVLDQSSQAVISVASAISDEKLEALLSSTPGEAEPAEAESDQTTEE
ncbi:MAG: 50S ribosomal protein L25 [Nitrospiria bacterium]